MDRLYRGLAGCGLALALVLPNSGCKSTRPEVPPNPSFTGNGQSPVGFSQEPNPVNGSAAMPPPGNSQFGVPSPSSAPSYGPPGNGGFGAPGTNLGTQPSMSPSAGMPGPTGSSAPGGSSNPMTGIPQTGTGSTGPASGLGAAPTASPFDR